MNYYTYGSIFKAHLATPSYKKTMYIASITLSKIIISVLPHVRLSALDTTKRHYKNGKIT